jgi:hypothetical protein
MFFNIGPICSHCKAVLVSGCAQVKIDENTDQMNLLLHFFNAPYKCSICLPQSLPI